MLFGIVQCCSSTCCLISCNVALSHAIWYRAMLLFYMLLVSCNVALSHAVWYRAMLLFHMLFGIVKCCSSTCCLVSCNVALPHAIFGIVQCCSFTCCLVSCNVAHPHAVCYRAMLFFHILFWYRAMLLLHMLFGIVQFCFYMLFGIVQCCNQCDKNVYISLTENTFGVTDRSWI